MDIGSGRDRREGRGEIVLMKASTEVCEEGVGKKGGGRGKMGR